MRGERGGMFGGVIQIGLCRYDGRGAIYKSRAQKR